MRKGTTPKHIFAIPADIAPNISKARVIYAQADEVILTKDAVVENGAVTVTLTQEETFMFDHKKPVAIQVRALANGTALCSNIMLVRCEKCLENEVLQ